MHPNQSSRAISNLTHGGSSKVIDQFLALSPYFTALLLSTFIAVYGEMFYEAYRSYATSEYAGIVTGTLTLGVFARTAALFVFCFVIGLIVIRFSNKILPFVYRYRYFIALTIALVFIFFELSGSSLGYWAAYIEDTGASETLFGFPRSIRSDEWLVNVSAIFSQAFNDYAPVSSIIRGTSTDVTLVSSLPAWSPATLFRPFLSGYLILGSAKGLAFSWIMSKLALFFVSFECAMLYTKQSKALSSGAAFLFTFSPMIAWWDTGAALIYGQGLVLALHFFLTTNTTPKKILASGLIAWLAGCYFLMLYPAWMVPFFYVFALMGIWVILQYRKSLRDTLTMQTFRPKRDIFLLASCCLIVALLIASVFLNAQEALSATSSTVYPAGRISMGGGDISSLFAYGTSLFFTTLDPQIPFNASESATIFTLFPIGLVFGCIQAYRTKDNLLAMLACTEIVFLVFYIIGFPEWLAKMTLLSYTPPSRLLLPLGFLDIVLLLRALALKNDARTQGSQTCSWKMSIVVSICTAVALSALCLMWNPGNIGLAAMILAAGVISLMVVQILLAFFTQKRIFIACFSSTVAVVLAVSGCCVSPIQRGTAPLTDNDLYRTVETLASSDDGLWIAENTVTMGDFCISAGAPTINSTNSYPDLQRWRQLDPTHESEKVYNRFAHIVIKLQETNPTTFNLLQEDMFQVDLNWKDLHMLDAKFLITPNRYDNAPVDGVHLTELTNTNGYRVYEISYKNA